MLLVSFLPSLAFAQARPPRGGLGTAPIWQGTVGLHLAASTDGVGVGVDADLLGGLFTTIGTLRERGWVTSVGPYVAADALIGRGVSASAGGRAITGLGYSFSDGYMPLGLAKVGVGYRGGSTLSGLRLDGQLRGAMAFELGVYATRDPVRGRLREWTATAGLNVPTAPAAYVADGRPLRTADGIVRARGGVARRTGSALHWLRRAEDEAAAVRAFQRLVGELRGAGAPAALVARAVRAVAEERQHTVACLQQAARHGGAAWLVAPPVLPARGADSYTATLARIAWEGHFDGHDNEGRAAEAAAGRAERARDAWSAAVEGRIAREEHGHAALGRELAAWARRAGGPAVGRAIDGPPPA